MNAVDGEGGVLDEKAFGIKGRVTLCNGCIPTNQYSLKGPFHGILAVGNIGADDQGVCIQPGQIAQIKRIAGTAARKAHRNNIAPGA